MTEPEPEPELLGTRICRVVKRASIFRSSFFYDRILNRPKYKNRIVGHDRMPTPSEGCVSWGAVREHAFL